MTATVARYRRIAWLPTTRMGRASAWLALGFLAWFVVNQTVIGMSETTTIPFPRAPMIAWGLFGIALGLVAGFVAALAIVRRHERSVVAFVALAPGLMMLALLAGEVFFPH